MSFLCQAQTLKDNCVSFGMPAPRLEGVDAIEEDLWATESSWALYKEYSSELKVWRSEFTGSSRPPPDVETYVLR